MAVSIERAAKKAHISKHIMEKALRLAVKHGWLKEVGRGEFLPTEKGMRIYHKFKRGGK